VSQASPYKGVNVVNTPPDGACIGWLLSRTSATRGNLAHQLTERRPFGNEVDLTNRRLNDRLNALRDVARSCRPSCLSRQERRHPPVFTEALDQAIESRDADPESCGGFSNGRSSDACRPLLCDQPSNFFVPAAGLVPTRSFVTGSLGRSVHVAALHSLRMGGKPLTYTTQQGIRPKLNESSQIDASANRLKVHKPLYRG
jgi:hypothetical protein